MPAKRVMTSYEATIALVVASKTSHDRMNSSVACSPVVLPPLDTPRYISGGQL